jgi:hypothetical protein
VPTLIYTTEAPPATFVLEDENEVKRELNRALEAGEHFTTFTGEGGKEVRVVIDTVLRVSPQ